jgi:hypothetical protein
VNVIRTFLAVAFTLWLLTVWTALTPAARATGQRQNAAHSGPGFQTADNCMACHNGLMTAAGEDVSIGSSWRASMMANSARDPYWQAAVRREVIDHPGARAEIENECARCHMPMASTDAQTKGRRAEIFAHLPIGETATPEALLGADGVSCTACHQIQPDGLGTRSSFTGGFVIDTTIGSGDRPIFGPYRVDAGRTTIMRSATGFTPTEGAHIQQSEMCATCHTLYTKALGPNNEIVGELPEQVPYLEWQHSAYRTERSCQSCHMPVVDGPIRIASVMGEPRPSLARHGFRGGNFFMMRMLNRYRTELGVQAPPEELDAAARETVQHLQSDTATVTVQRARRDGNRLEIDVAVQNLAGHKLPTGYPSRRVWLHVVVREGSGRVVFESGRIAPSGLIEGNDNDADPTKYEPHYTEIRDSAEVQIYEAVMADSTGALTTGLLSAVRFVKDNRLLPRGFDKATAASDIAVQGAAAHDDDFSGSGDTIRYSVDISGETGPFTTEVALRFQPIAFRWARNLDSYDAPETRRFVSYFDSMAEGSSEVLARAVTTVQ